MNGPDIAQRILRATRNVAIVGASDDPQRDSYRIFSYLVRQGFKVFPVNPHVTEIQGTHCVARLAEIGAPIDTVVCFRRSSMIEPVAIEAVAIGAHHLWMQFGVVNERARQIAEEEGLLVVMDRCIMVDHQRWGT